MIKCKNIKVYLFVALVLFNLSILCGKDKPNIIFILADDLGCMDVNYFAHHLSGIPTDSMFYETPNIDKLAEHGIAFSQAYANQLCSPTRASLLTGKFASRLGFTTATPNTLTYYSKDTIAPAGYHPLDAINHHDNLDIPSPLLNATSLTALPSGLPTDNGVDETTIAEALKGYQSAFLGKWHLGGHGTKGYQPADQGFQEIAYCDAGGSPYYNWRGKWGREKLFFESMPQDKLYMGKPGNTTGQKYLTDDLTLQAINYIEEQSKNEKPFFLYFCHFAVHSPWQAKRDVANHFENKPTKGWNGHSNVNYATMIQGLDQSVGMLMNALKRLEIDDNTIIIFMSDNGALEYNKKWGNITSNQPLKGGKACLTEGGVRVPLIISDPRVKKQNKWCHVPVNCTDIFPTIIDLASQNPKKFYKSIDGRSIAPLLTDVLNSKNKFEEKAIIWHYPFNVVVTNPNNGYPLTPHSAIRKGDYKLIADWAGNIMLYNIAKDISEKHNLAYENIDLRNELYHELISWLNTNIEKRYWPRVNPDYIAEDDPRDYQFIEARDILKTNREGAKSMNNE